MNKIFSFFAALIWMVSFVLIFLSQFGKLHPAFDSLAIIGPIFWLAMIFTFWVLPKPWMWLALVITLAFAWPYRILISHANPNVESNLRILSHNLLFTNQAIDLPQLVQWVKPDVLALQEIDTALPTVQSLTTYPHQQICSFASIGDTGIISKLEFIDQGCSKSALRGFTWVRVKTKNNEDVTIVSMHLHWPYPFGQHKQLKEILPEIEALPKPIIIAGDLNQVSWSYTVKSLEKASGAPLLSGLRFTLVRPPLFLPIDHVFGAGQYNIRKLDRYGSDHNATLIDFEGSFLQGN